MTKVVVTGLGCASAFGLGVEALWHGLRTGRSAVAPIRRFDPTGLPTILAAELTSPDPTSEAWWPACPRANRAVLEAAAARGAARDPKLALAMTSVDEALAMASLDGDARRAAVLSLGVGVETAFLADLAAIRTDHGFAWRGTAEPAAAVRHRMPTHVVAEAIRTGFDLGPAAWLHASACAAGALAVAHGAALIRRGHAEVVIAGAADSMINPVGVGGMAMLGATTTLITADACRPFDVQRAGTVIGEGAGILVLESEAHARRRGATWLAEIAGWGSSQDGHRPSAPEPSGVRAAEAMRHALAMAGLTQVDYINAHGTGTALNDVAEARAIQLAFGSVAAEIAVSSIKGAVGHLMAASGALELVATVQALRTGWLPGTCNLTALDEEISLRVLGPAGLEARAETAMSNSFGFGGQNAAVVVRRAGGAA